MYRMLAVEHWYTSAAFWGAAGVAAVVVVGIATILVMLRGTPRRRLTYATPAVTPLLSTPLGPRKSDIKVTFLGGELDDPHFLRIRLENQGGRDIRSSDFDQGKPLILDVHADIVGTLAVEGTHGQFHLNLAQRNRLELKPTLIKGHQVITIDLLVDGAEPYLTCEDSLIDVTVQEQRPDEIVPPWHIGAFGIMFVILLAAVASALFHAPSWIFYGGILVIAVILTALAVSFVRDVRRRQSGRGHRVVH